MVDDTKHETKQKKGERQMTKKTKEAEAKRTKEEEAKRIEEAKEAEAKSNCSKIKANVLGSIAVDLRSTEGEVEYNSVLNAKARKHKTTPEHLAIALKSHLDKLPTGQVIGQLDGRRKHLAKVEASAFKACQWDNTLLAMDIDKQTSESLAEFVRGLQQAKLELIALLHSTDYTASATQTYAYFVHSPVKNLWTDEDIDVAEFYLMSTGWDGKRLFPYYGVRMTPSDNREKTSEIQYVRPTPVI